MRYGTKLSKYEKREANAEKIRRAMEGSGVYIFENRSNSDLRLPKPAISGETVVGPGKKFQGDSYFMSLVGSPMNMLRVVEIVNEQKEDTMEEKLILDQPDLIKTNGKVEFVVDNNKNKTIPLNDNTVNKQNEPVSDVLLTEAPLDGVEIVLSE